MAIFVVKYSGPSLLHKVNGTAAATNILDYFIAVVGFFTNETLENSFRPGTNWIDGIEEIE